MRGASGELLLAQIDLPQDRLWLGPTGYRMKVVDFDASTNKLYVPHTYETAEDGTVIDPFAPVNLLNGSRRRTADKRILSDPQFHSQNVYAIVMRTLARFEQALGRRVSWGFDGHQLHIVPHAFVDANAFYSKDDRALMFGYFTGSRTGSRVFTCLSHDIVAHEATHAILDGLRMGFITQSGPDQAAFHEGFSDVVALLSILSLEPIVNLALTQASTLKPVVRGGVKLINGDLLDAQALSDTLLFGLGKEFGQELDGLRANALRRSVRLRPSRSYATNPEFLEPHRRGEVFAAAMLRSMLEMWLKRIQALGTFGDNLYNLDSVVAEGAKVADHLLTMSIRSLDYCPPLDLEFSDYLTALLTVDSEVAPNDSRYDYRTVIRNTFGSYGIHPAESNTGSDGCWTSFSQHDEIVYHKTNFESMLRDREEVFRFIWENRSVLDVDENAYTQVTSVRPSTRFGPDGFLLKETICEYTSRFNIFGSELKSYCECELPEQLTVKSRITVYGGGTLVFDQYGRIKYHVSQPIRDGKWQAKRLSYLLEAGLDVGADQSLPFAEIHQLRASQDWNDLQGRT